MRLSKRHLLPCILLGASFLAMHGASAQKAFRPEVRETPQSLKKATPYQNNDGAVPPRSQYQGPLFVLNHAWPTKPLPPLKNAPWQAAIHNGKITPENAAAYAEALKAAVSANGRHLIMHYDTWNAAKAGWYNEPWLGSLRESIHGTYDAGEFGPGIFPNTGLRAQFNTHVVTYYDARAAYTLRKVWAASAMKPAIKTANTQFEEGAIVVKAAVFASEDVTQPLDWWDAMKGAQVWQMYIPVGDADPPPAPQLWPGYVAQFDIIVKDSQSAPATGWVYMTLVYDSAAAGDVWDKMVPLGVQWGNDPQANAEGMPLKENWNNPKAPLYSTETLGWGGRLSGPNDGARNDIVVDGAVMKNAPDSSCLSCHSTAQWNVKAHNMPSFLLPSFAAATPPGFQTCDADGKPDPKNQGPYICSPAPGSAAWMKWFQNRPGTESMDPGSVATDFDEVFSFKSFKLWWLAVGPSKQPAPLLLRSPFNAQRFNLYSGAPLPKP
jgi:hypothetical protein